MAAMTWEAGTIEGLQAGGSNLIVSGTITANGQTIQLTSLNVLIQTGGYI